MSLMNSDTRELSPWERQLGLTPGNPFAPWLKIALVVAVIANLAVITVTLFGPSLQVRYIAGIVFIFVGSLTPIPPAILIIFARNYARIQQMIIAGHWAHWQYDPLDSQKYVGLLPWPDATEVYLSREAIFWPAQKLRPVISPAA